MAPRKRKAADERHSSTPQPNGSASKEARTKPKIDWSELGEVEFTVKSITVRPQKGSSTPAAKKQKTSDNSPTSSTARRNSHFVGNPFPEANFTDVYLEIKPADLWDACSRYRKFTLEDSAFRIEQMVYIKQKGGEPDGIAMIVEIRGGNPTHVYLRIQWMYRPEELPEGRQPYHGSHELIASNHAEIVDAKTVQDPVEVIYFNDDPELTTTNLEDGQYFWRVGHDFNKPKDSQLGKYNTYCVDKKPYNPDVGLVQCPNCSMWLHASCLTDQAIRDAHAEEDEIKTEAPKKKKGRPSKRRKIDDPSTAFSAKYFTLPGGRGCITVTDKRPGQESRNWNVDIHCLSCNGLIEKAPDDLEEDSDDVKEEEDEESDSPTDNTNNTTPQDHNQEQEPTESPCPDPTTNIPAPSSTSNPTTSTNNPQGEIADLSLFPDEN